jgi:hypothetical protein
MPQALRRSSLAPTEFVVEIALCDANRTVIVVRPSQSFGLCPSCGTVSRRVHSRYRRRVGEGPNRRRTSLQYFRATEYQFQTGPCWTDSRDIGRFKQHNRRSTRQEAATAPSLTGRILKGGGGLVTPRSDRVACGRTKKPPPIREAAIASLKAPLRPVPARLIQRMRVRSGKLRAGEGFLSSVVVKPMLAWLEARDYRVTRGVVVFRCMPTRGTIAAADVTALGASAKMKPPSADSRALDTTRSAWLSRWVDTIPLGLHRLLSDFRLLQLLRRSMKIRPP